VVRVAIIANTECFPPDTILPIQLQPDNASSCNWYRLRIANTKYFRADTIISLKLQPDSSSSCNWYKLRVANTKFFACYCTTPSVATEQWFALQSMYAPSCKYWVLPPNIVLPPSIATRQRFELQPMYTPSCKYWGISMIPPFIERWSNLPFFSLFFFSFLNVNVIGILFQLQLEHHLQLQPTTIWVAIDIWFDFVNIEYFRLIFVLPLLFAT
jgi:hypothetical protein